MRIVDFTGSSEFGNWLEANARQAVVYTEKSGLNTVIVDSTDDYKGLLRNLAFSLSLYSGQMCTTPQNILVPAGGIETDAGHRSPDEFGADLAGAVDKLLGDPKRAAGTLGAIVNDGVLARLDRGRRRAPAWCRRRPREVADEPFPGATIRTPVIVRLDAGGREGLHPRVVRAGLVRHRHRVHRGTACDLFAETVRAPRRADRVGLLDLAGGARGRPRGGARRRRAPVARTSPAASSSTRRPRSATCTAPAPTRPRPPR